MVRLWPIDFTQASAKSRRRLYTTNDNLINCEYYGYFFSDGVGIFSCTETCAKTQASRLETIHYIK